MLRVINGNSFEALPVLITDGVKNPVIVTDPPYNIGYHYEGFTDKKPSGEYFSGLSFILSFCSRSVIIHYPEDICRISMEFHKQPERIISWVYNSNTNRQHRDIAFWGFRPDFSKVKQPYKNQTDKRVIELQKRTGGAKCYDWIFVNQVKNVSREKTVHPCQMPLEVMTNIIKMLPEGSTVIDPFCGSGTTGVACAEQGVSFIGIEIVPEYARLSYQRITFGGIYPCEFIKLPTSVGGPEGVPQGNAETDNGTGVHSPSEVPSTLPNPSGKPLPAITPVSGASD